MADNTIIPRTIHPFDDYIRTTDDRLQATNPDTTNPYYEDYGIEAADATEWHTRRLNWQNDLWPLYSSPVSSSTVVKADVRSFMEDFRPFAGPLIDLIEVSPICGNAEEHIFNFVLHRKNPTHRSTPFAEECVAGIHSEGRGMYEMMCRASSDEGRPGKVEGADSVQYAHVITTESPNPIPPPGDPSLIKDISTKAIFHRDFGAENVGRWLTIYFRWYNTKNPAIAGAWNVAQTLVIS